MVKPSSKVIAAQGGQVTRAVPKAALLGTTAGLYYEKVTPGGYLGQLMAADAAKKQQKAEGQPST